MGMNSAISDVDPLPVALVHGWGGSFDATWVQPGITALLTEGGREVIGIDLPGHGTADRSHDPEAYRDLAASLLGQLGSRRVDAVGFSLGALTLLRAAIAAPQQFSALVLAGIGRNVLEPDDAGLTEIIAALESAGAVDRSVALEAGATSQIGQMFVNYARRPGNDLTALTAVLKRPPAAPITAAQLASLTMPILIVIGERDFVAPADDLIAALPNAKQITLAGVDHFATTESFGFIDAMLEFFDAVPG
jgi:pimeloyl-ACP methyl ester carboxylesterase